MELDSSKLNFIAMGVLSTCLLVFGLHTLGGILYHADKPEKPGMVVEVADDSASASEEKAEEIPPVATLLASADVAKGEKAAKPCLACHTFEKDGNQKQGPNLWNIVDRAIASIAEAKYSKGMQEKSSEKWTYDNLNLFLLKPKDFINKTTMSFPGIKQHDKRADLIAYLRSLSDSPVALPAVETPAPASETPAPASETPAPASETPAPASETPAPKSETPAPAPAD